MKQELKLPLMLVILSALSWIASFYELFDINCTGIIGWVNPLCWINSTYQLFMVMTAIILFVAAIIFYFVTDNQIRWAITFIGFVFITFLAFMTPDALPIIDELVLTVTSIIAGYKALGSNGSNKNNVF